LSQISILQKQLSIFIKLLNNIDTHEHENKESCPLKASLENYTSKLLIRKKLTNNQNLNKKVVFIVLI